MGRGGGGERGEAEGVHEQKRTFYGGGKGAGASRSKGEKSPLDGGGRKPLSRS